MPNTTLHTEIHHWCSGVYLYLKPLALIAFLLYFKFVSVALPCNKSYTHAQLTEGLLLFYSSYSNSMMPE